MKEFSGVISEYKRGSGEGGTYLTSIPGGYLMGKSSSTLANAAVKIGDNYLLKLQVIQGLASHMSKAHTTRKPCTLYIHRRRLIGIKLDSGELYFYRKRVVLGSLIMLVLLSICYLMPIWAWIFLFPLAILVGAVFWAMIWEMVYYFDGKKLEKLGGIPVSMYGDRLDVRSAI